MRAAALVVLLEAFLLAEAALALAIVFGGVSVAWAAVGGPVFLVRGSLGLSLPQSSRRVPEQD